MLKVSEHYISTQGEGPRVGQLTQFLRFAGCNLRCPGWPCDTPHAIFPEIWRTEARAKTLDDILLECVENRPILNVCWTGGEPFVQKDADLLQLAGLLQSEGFFVECFTNGTFLFPEWALQRLVFIMDWKLQGSGEAEVNRPIKIQNALNLKTKDSIKFTVATMEDLWEAKDVYSTLEDQGCKAQYYVGPVWGQIDAAFLVEWLIKEGLTDWTLNVQTHKFIWSPDQRGV